MLLVRTVATELPRGSYNLQEVGLAKSLVKRGHVCDIVYYKRTRGVDIETVHTPRGSIRIYHVGGLNILGDAWFGREVDELIMSYDVVQVSECDRLYSSWVCFRYSNVVVYHGPYAVPSSGFKNRLRAWRGGALCRLFGLIARLRHVQILTKSVLAEEYLRDKGLPNVSTVGVGLDPESIGDQPPVRRDADFCLLSIGKLHENKNQMFLLDVLERCLDSEPNLHLYLIGSGTGRYADAVRDRLSRSLDGAVTYLPSVPQAQLGAYYLMCDAFVLPSRYEIFGMVLLEAAWFECPIVSSRNGGSATILEPFGFGSVLRSFDVQVWADTLIRVLHDRSKAGETENPLREMVDSSFTWEALAAQFELAYSRAGGSR